MLLKIIELTGTQTAKKRNHAESAIDGVISGRLGPGSRSAQKSSAKDREGLAGAAIWAILRIRESRDRP
jgi:hypothetical protein